MLWEDKDAKDTPIEVTAIPMAVPIDDTWKLTFDEEFNGDTLDTTKWVSNWFGSPGQVTKPCNSNETAAYNPANVSVSGGCLRIKATAQNSTVAGKTYPDTSGIINSYQAYWQTFGYFEAKMNLVGQTGAIANWPAFWLDGENWPADGEIDVMEGLNGKAAFHLHNSAGSQGGAAAGDFTGWHTYGVLWVPGKLEFYYDRNLVGTITNGVTTKPMYIIVNHAVGTYGGPRVLPCEMAVEYVRAWSNDPAAIAVPPQPGYTPPWDTTTPPPGGSTPPDIDARLTALEADVAALKTHVTALDARLDKIAAGATG